MHNDCEEDNDRNLTTIRRTSSVDSLDQTDFPPVPRECLRFLSGYHQWVNTEKKIQVEKIINDQTSQPQALSTTHSKTTLKHQLEHDEEEEEEEDYSVSQMDISLNHFDVQLQVSSGQLQPAVRYGVFSSTVPTLHQNGKINIFTTNQSAQTSEMDVENEDNTVRNGKGNGYSPHRNNNHEESYGRNRQTSGSSNNNNNGANPNRNNNNSRRSSGDDSDDDDDDDDFGDDYDDDDDDVDDDIDETDESISRRLDFFPLDQETIHLVGRLRRLTKKNTFERRDFETLQSLIEELIHLQRLENASKDQLKRIIHYLKLHRPLRSKSRALLFIQEHIPRRAVKYNVIASTNEPHSNVFNIWRERERRARQDSKDSLEDDGQHSSGQQLRDVIEINHPTPPIVLSTTSSSPSVTTKVKQMAKDIDTRSVSSRSEINLRTGDRFSDHAHLLRSSSPTYPGLVSVAIYDVKVPNNKGLPKEILSEEPSPNKRTINPPSSVSPTPSEQSRVRQMIDRLESTSSSTSHAKAETKTNIKKSLHDDHSDGSTSLTSSPPVKRVARRDENEKNFINANGQSHGLTTGFVSRQSNVADDIVLRNTTNKNHSTNEIKFELHREGRTTSGQRTVSGTNMEEYITNLHPDTKTSVSMVRDMRARVYEDTNAVSRTDIDTIPMKVDLETLYILEEKFDKRSSPPAVNIYLPEYEYSHTSTTERHDFAMQTPSSAMKPMQIPIGTQVNSIIEQHTVAAQTTDSLHRPAKERQPLPSSPLPPPPPSRSSSSSSSHVDDAKNVRTSMTTTTITRYEAKRRHSSHHSSEEENATGAVIYIDEKAKTSEHEDNFELKREKRHSSTDDHLPVVPEQRPSFGQVTSRIRIDQLRDINRHVVRRHVQEDDHDQEEHRSTEVYEIHTRGACKCLVVSSEEKTQHGCKTRFEKQLQRIERTYTDEELKVTELHVIVASSDSTYQLVKRDYGFTKHLDDEKENQSIDGKSKQPTVLIHYYNKDGHRMRTEHGRHLEHLPLVIRCEIEYELNHYGSAQLIILSVTNSERRQMNTSLKKELVAEIVSRSGGRLSANSPELEQEITRQLAEPTTLLHLVDYSSREDYNQTNSTDLRRVSRIDVTTSLRLVQRYRTEIHRLCQLHRSHLRLTPQAEQQRHLVLVARDEYYLFDLTSQSAGPSSNISDIRQRQHDIFKREVHNVTQPPFDYAKFRRDNEQQQRLLEQHYQQKQMEQRQQAYKGPPPPGHPSEAEFYLGAGRRALIEREINSMREAIRPHDNAPPRYKREAPRRSLSISYSGGQRYVRARIIHVKDFYDETHLRDVKQQQRQAKEQELFVRVDDYINESAANSVRRSYSTDYLHEDGPRSRVRYIRIPGDTIKIEEKKTYEYKGVMYADLPYSLRYWNILYILDREAQQGRPLGSTLPQVIVNDPYRTVIPPLTQQEIRQTAQQILSPQYNARSYTDQTLRWFLSRDNRTEIESAKYLQTIDQYRKQQPSTTSGHTDKQTPTSNKYCVTEKLIRYEKMPDRLVPTPTHSRTQSTENIHHRSPSIPHILHPPNLPPMHTTPRSQSQPRPYHPSSTSSRTPTFQIPQQQQHAQLPPIYSPLSRHQSVHELHAPSALSRPPSPSPSLHSLHSNHNHPRRLVAFNNRFPSRPPSAQQNAILTEIIDGQSGRRLVTTSQEQLPSEVLGLLHKYNLQQF